MNGKQKRYYSNSAKPKLHLNELIPGATGHVDIHDVIIRSLDGSSTCNICCKTYMHYSTAKRHFKESHADTQEFKCIICAKIYTRYRSLKFHMASAHKTE